MQRFTAGTCQNGARTKPGSILIDMKKIIPGRQCAIALLLLMIVAGAACSKKENITLRNEQFALHQVGNSGVSGTVFIAENMDSSFNITVKLNSSVKDSVHVMNIYHTELNNVSSVAVKLSNITGTGGPVIGETKNIRQAVETTGNFGTVTYDKAIQQTLVVKVFLSAARTDSVICRGEIGK
jgi:hypothetical protein